MVVSYLTYAYHGVLGCCRVSGKAYYSHIFRFPISNMFAVQIAQWNVID